MSPPVCNNPHNTPQYDPQYNPCEKFGVKGGPAFWRPQFQLSLESFKAPKTVLLAAENTILSVLQLGTQHLETMKEYKDETLPESSREPAKGLPHLPKPSRPFTPLKPPSASEGLTGYRGMPGLRRVSPRPKSTYRDLNPRLSLAELAQCHQSIETLR